jgi:nitrogen fixation NifU-like protein
MYSATLLDHFRHPRNQGTLDSPAIAAERSNPLCGDRLRIEISLAGDRVDAARFRGDACAIAIAAASVLTERLGGLTLAEAEGIEPSEIVGALDAEIRPARLKCATLALEALRSGIATFRLRA